MSEYKLKYTAKQIEERLTKVDTIPTKTSELTNDSGYITASDIPSIDAADAVTAHNVDPTAHEDIRQAIPTKTSELTNDSGFITAADIPGGGGGGDFTETDPTVPEHVKSITAEDIANWNNKPSIDDVNSAIETAIGNAFSRAY